MSFVDTVPPSTQKYRRRNEKLRVFLWLYFDFFSTSSLATNPPRLNLCNRLCCSSILRKVQKCVSMRFYGKIFTLKFSYADNLALGREMPAMKKKIQFSNYRNPTCCILLYARIFNMWEYVTQWNEKCLMTLSSRCMKGKAVIACWL